MRFRFIFVSTFLTVASSVRSTTNKDEAGDGGGRELKNRSNLVGLVEDDPGVKGGAVVLGDDDDELINVFVAYSSKEGRDKILEATTAAVALRNRRNGGGDSSFSEAAGNNDSDGGRHRGHVRHKFDEISTLALELTVKEVKQLQDDYAEDIEYIENDSWVYPDAQITPYGKVLTNADDIDGNFFSSAPQPRAGGSAAVGSCDSPDTFKVGIVDTGIQIKHPDLPCTPRHPKKSINCVGRSFDLSKKEKWFNSKTNHGTHIMGIIGALDNDLGVVGMIPDPNVCYLIARVFGDRGSATFSTLLSAIQWAASQGASVVNLSLGGAAYTLSGAKFFASLMKQNVMVVGSAGNEGTTEYRYPGSYPSVQSVGAVDEFGKLTSYSQRNDKVNLVGPGEWILSTVPKSEGGFVTVSVTDPTTSDQIIYRGSLMDFSASTPNSGIVAKEGLSFCSDGGKDRCQGVVNGTVCLMERGIYRFEKMGMMCEQAGGVACIIYNQRPGMFTGGLAEPSEVKIPVVTISQEDGLELLSNYLNITTPIQIQDQKGYAYLSGTSMAVPHVTGAIARVWRACPSCSAKDVQKCMYKAARGRTGFGYGHGLVNTIGSYNCLAKRRCCK